MWSSENEELSVPSHPSGPFSGNTILSLKQGVIITEVSGAACIVQITSGSWPPKQMGVVGNSLLEKEGFS